MERKKQGGNGLGLHDRKQKPAMHHEPHGGRISFLLRVMVQWGWFNDPGLYRSTDTCNSEPYVPTSRGIRALHIKAAGQSIPNERKGMAGNTGETGSRRLRKTQARNARMVLVSDPQDVHPLSAQGKSGGCLCRPEGSAIRARVLSPAEKHRFAPTSSRCFSPRRS